MPRNSPHRRAYTLTELMAVLGILGALALLIVPRVVVHHETTKRAACDANQRDIELQARLWQRDQGTYPSADLSNIGSNAAFFPNGLPACPVDGAAYTIDTSSGLVIGHTH